MSFPSLPSTDAGTEKLMALCKLKPLRLEFHSISPSSTSQLVVGILTGNLPSVVASIGG
jgi:hypothetical protein